MGAVYTVGMHNQTIVADATLVIIRAATAITSRASLLRVNRVYVDQIGTETSDQLGVIFGGKLAAFGTYTSTAPVPNAIGGAASGIAGGTTGAAATSGTDATAEGAGAVTALITRGFNNLNGFEFIWTPDARPWILPDLVVVLKIVGTPVTLTGWNAGIEFEEIN